MIVHTKYDEETKTKSYTMEVQYWYERFYTHVSIAVLESNGFVVGSLLNYHKYYYVSTDERLRMMLYAKIYIIPFIRVGMYVKRKWYNMAYWFWRKGLLENRPPEGYKISWFWLKYISWKKKR